MQTPDLRTLRAAIFQLEQEHRTLDARIETMAADVNFDHLELRRLKKRKLAIKDQLARLRSDSIPDLNA